MHYGLSSKVKIHGLGLRGSQGLLGACLPIVDVPVHIVTGMPMTVGMGMRMAITMGTKNT